MVPVFSDWGTKTPEELKILSSPDGLIRIVSTPEGSSSNLYDKKLLVLFKILYYQF